MECEVCGPQQDAGDLEILKVVLTMRVRGMTNPYTDLESVQTTCWPLVAELTLCTTMVLVCSTTNSYELTVQVA